MSDNIPPYEIQLEIIKKVPDVKSLIRFRAVSKPWKFFIASSEFITRIEVAYDCFIDDVSFPLKEGSSPNVPQLVYQLNHSDVIGSSCGLWSFHDYRTQMVAIWNPSIRKLVRIVVPNNISQNITHFGFGVCPSTYDPTILGISWYSPYRNVKNKVHIFTLSSKTWKMIPTSNLPRQSVQLLMRTQVAIDRIISETLKMSDNIPYEIQLEIIKKAPDVKSLLRFRSVSKEWKSFIDSSEFITSYCARDTEPHRLLLRYSQSTIKQNITWEVGIFTLSTKTWKMIPTSNLPREPIGLGSAAQVAIDRFIFWVAYDMIGGNDVVSQNNNLILSFDLITHEFKEIHLPVSITNHKFKEISLCELNESLVVSAHTNEVNDGRVYGVWMMGEEAGGMTSFTKLFNIKIPDSSLTMTLLGFRKSGQPIMETGKKDQEFIEEFAEENAEQFEGFDEAKEFAEENAEDFAALEVYEPCSEQINDLGIKGEMGSLFMCPYKETLLLADHSDANVNAVVYGVWMMGEEGGVMTSFTKLFNVNTPDFSLSLHGLLGFRKSGQPIIETVADRQGEDDGSGARCGARNDRVLEAYTGLELGFMKLNRS
nr:hypothetical protein [Tanacetum cinerariifolium]